MRALLQRVNNASVRVNGNIVGKIDKGLLVFFCAMQGDGEKDAFKLAQKISKLRIFDDQQGKMNLSLLDIKGQALVVSQFTLAAESKGNRPGYSKAAEPRIGEQLYLKFISDLKELGLDIQKGQFGSNMEVELTNCGPVTIWIDSSLKN